MARENAKRELAAKEPDFLTRAKQDYKGKPTYVCLVCKNGSGKDGTGIHRNPKSEADLPHWRCTNCGYYGDIIDLWKKHKGIYDDAEAFRTLYEHCGIEIDKSVALNKPKKEQKPAMESKITPTTETNDYTEYYKECVQRLSTPEATSYLKARGISTETAAAYWIGYDPEWRSPTALKSGKKPPITPRMILPISKNYYVARDIRENLNDTEKRFAKMNEGSADIFNLRALKNGDHECVFVLEGFFDAMSVIEVGGAAIALNSTSNARKLIEYLEHNPTRATLILCLDNDDAGARAAETIAEGAKRLNVSYVITDISSGLKDPNDALQANREQFTEEVQRAIRQTYRPDNISDYIDKSMSLEMQKFKECGNKRTGFKNLDDEAKGIYPGLYVVAAISSLGKTTLCHQIADQLAQMGEDVLFFSLEQSRLELVSKSIARTTAKKDLKTAVSSLSIRRGYLPEHVLTAADEYQKSVRDRISIIEGNFNCNISFIGEYIRRYISKTGKTPVIFLDYLQILLPEKDERGRTQTAKESVDHTITELKRLSREMDLTIFVISSVNRANYLTPIDFESLKESGGIEYTADVVWGLQLQVINDKVFDTGTKENLKAKRAKVKEAKKASPRKLELVCLKNRYGISNFSVYFDYFPEFDLVTEGNKVAPEGRQLTTREKMNRRQ